MARSAEKAMTALARWRAAYVDKIPEKRKRPGLATECTVLKDALYYRKQIVIEISRKLAQIQNPSLGEYKLRDLNDEINKLVRERGHWEDQIKELGGPDYKEQGPKMLDREGKYVPGNQGYRYYGAVRDLPGVRELFEVDPQPLARKTRAELMKLVDAQFYGYRDEEDGVIVPLERQFERKLRRQKHEEWLSKRGKTKKRLVTGLVATDEYDPAMEAFTNIYKVDETIDEKNEEKILATSSKTSSTNDAALSKSPVFVPLASSTECRTAVSSMYHNLQENELIAHVPLPTQEQIERAIVERKKKELIEQYMSDDLIANLKATEETLGVQSSLVGDDTKDQSL